MRILFVSPHFPQDFSRSVYGVFQRMRMWLDAIQSLDADLDILFFPRPGATAGSETASETARRMADLWRVRARVALCERDADPVSSRGRLAEYAASYLLPALGVARHPEFRPYVGPRLRDAMARSLERSPDVVLFHRLQAIIPARGLSHGGARCLLDLDDVEHRKFAREVAQPPHWRLKGLLYLQLPALWWAERAAIRRCDLAFVCSETDRRYVLRSMRTRNVEVIPNAVPRSEGAGRLTVEPNVLFIGAFSYAPNIVAAEYLIREVWPILVRRHAGARLLIAGPRCDALPSFQAPPAGIEFLGFVPDLEMLYRRARVVCCPIWSGSGTRIKILEAASRGIPVVTTAIGAEGLHLARDTDIIVRDDATGLAEACAVLLRDDVRAAAMAESARERVRALYNRPAVVDRMRAILVGDDSASEPRVCFDASSETPARGLGPPNVGGAGR